MTNKKDFYIGQKIWYVNEGRNGLYRTVTKVGRDWVYLNNGNRFNIETMKIDGGNYFSPGKCYLSEEDEIKERELNKAWQDFKTKIRNIYHVPKSVTIEDIKQTEKLIFKE